MADNPSHSENELAKLLRDGDNSAFRALYDIYKQPLFRKLLRLVKQKDVAQELLQDVFFRLWEKRDTVEPERGVGALLYCIAQHKVTDFYRRAAYDRKLLDHLSIAATELYDPCTERDENDQTKHILQQALNILPPQRKKVFMLCKLEGKTYKEASEILGISLSTIRDHMTKASKTLQEHFGNREVAILLITALLSQH